MVRMMIVAVTLALLAAPSAPAQTDLGDNAALWYWRAFGLWWDNREFHYDHSDEIEEALLEPEFEISEQSRRRIAKPDVIANLETGALIDRCDFGISGGYGTLLPHIRLVRDAVTLVLAQARLKAAGGDDADAGRLLALAIRLIDHQAQRGIMISSSSSMDLLERCLAVGRVLIQHDGVDLHSNDELANVLSSLDEGDPMHARSALINDMAVVAVWLERALSTDAGREELAEHLGTTVTLPDGEPLEGTDEATELVLRGDADELVDSLHQATEAIREAWDAADSVEQLAAVQHAIADGEYGAAPKVMIPNVLGFRRDANNAANDLAAFKDLLTE